MLSPYELHKGVCLWKKEFQVYSLSKRPSKPWSETPVVLCDLQQSGYLSSSLRYLSTVHTLVFYLVLDSTLQFEEHGQIDSTVLNMVNLSCIMGYSKAYVVMG